jgi:hypothetical protein
MTSGRLKSSLSNWWLGGLALLSLSLPGSGARAAPDNLVKIGRDLVLACGDRGNLCTTNADCCANENGTGPGDLCQTLPDSGKACCSQPGDDCASSNDCCISSHASCTSQHGTPVCCDGYNVQCTTTNDCCNHDTAGIACTNLPGLGNQCCKARGSACSAQYECCRPSNALGASDDCIDGYCCGSDHATCATTSDCCYPYTCQSVGGVSECIAAAPNQTPCGVGTTCWSGSCVEPDPNDGFHDGAVCWAYPQQLCPGMALGPSITYSDRDCEGFSDVPAGWLPGRANEPPQLCIAKDAKGRFVCCGEPGYPCLGAGDCCSGSCGGGGTCACNNVGGSCLSYYDCCSYAAGDLCTAPSISNRGVAGVCCYASSANTLHCTKNADCCSGTCNNPGPRGSCACSGAGAACYSNADCCTGKHCLSGFCG